MFQKFISWIRQVIARVFSKKTIQQATGADLAVSDAMAAAIDLWMKMYMGQAPWLASTHMRSLNLPAQIASDIAQLVTLEMQVNIAGSIRADYIAEQMQPVLKDIRRYTEYACAGGGLVFKPYPDPEKGTIEVDFTQSNNFLPAAYNSRGEITDGFFVETKIIGKTYYRRLERHTLSARTVTSNGVSASTGIYTVTNSAYKSQLEMYLGEEVALSSVDDWASLEPEVTIENTEKPLFAYFKMPFANQIDPLSPLGVSVYARAVDLIEDADRQYTRYLWEFEGGELAIEASKDVFPLDKKGNPIVPVGKERLFRPNELDAGSSKDSELIKTFNPTLRDESYSAGLERIFKQIEDKCGLARGTLADPQTDAKTATEIKLMRQRSYISVTDIQKAEESALDSLIYAMDVYATLYNLAPAGAIETVYKWDDSIITDAEAERMRDKDDVTAGLMQKWEYRVKWYGEDETAAKAAIAAARGETDNEIMGFGGTMQ